MKALEAFVFWEQNHPSIIQSPGVVSSFTSAGFSSALGAGGDADFAAFGASFAFCFFSAGGAFFVSVVVNSATLNGRSGLGAEDSFSIAVCEAMKDDRVKNMYLFNEAINH